MIQANELRIGNYVNYLGEATIVTSISKGSDIDYISTKKSGICTSSSFSPVLLTEGILLKCGFQEIYRSDYSIRYELLDNPKIEYKWNNTFGWNLFCQGWCIENIKYLHQLQNAVLFLNGEELEVSWS